ncbi:tetratricopeptide repeat protein [candidate division WOR-3 bacterium]|uniref:Tetratricopeptide repeat protein n=1 Tax=candidate division WOR-3 bacterium TaxID=2052148 RepID=A0A937XGG4_UNCW3|nr:tetratricopeptide repeat protein [candidate division WOR-3 bacterium]
MTWLILVIIAVLVVALYPVIRDFLRRRRSAAPSYVEGLQAALDGRVADAIARLKEAVGTDSDNVDAYIRLGDLFMQQGEVERAIKVHENLSLRRNLDKRDEKKVLQALVRDYSKTERKVKAISLLEELVHMDKNDMASAEKLAELYIETGAWDKSEGLLKELARHQAQRQRAARLYTEYGHAYPRNNPGAALAAFETALKLDPGSIPARLYLGDHQLSQGDTNAAIKTWNDLLDLAPDKNALVRDRLERAYFDAGKFEDITALYERLLRKVPDDSGLIVALAEIYQKKEDLTSAIRLLERYASGQTSEVLPRVALAAMYLERDETERARAVLAMVLSALQPDAVGQGYPRRPA